MTAGVTELIACDHCRGYGSLCSTPRCRLHECSRCLGSCHTRCHDCTEPATRTSLSDHDVKMCAACGTKDDAELAQWLGTQPIAPEVQLRWIAMLATMPTAEVHRLCGLTNAQYVDEVLRLVAQKEAA